MVDQLPGAMEWQKLADSRARGSDRVRCLPHRLGGGMPRGQNRGTVVSRGDSVPHQLLRNSSSLPGNQNIHEGQEGHISPPPDRQYHSSGLYQSPGGNSVPYGNRDCQGPMDVVPREGHHNKSPISTRSRECEGRQRVQSDAGPLGLDAESSDLSGDTGPAGPSGLRPVCISANSSTPTILQLETRPFGSGHGCPATGLGRPESLCEPPLEPVGQSPSKGPERAGGSSTNDRTSVANTALVPEPARPVDRLPEVDSSGGEHPLGNSSVTSSSSSATASRVAYLKQRYSSESLSTGAGKLLLASWRAKSAKSYDSMFQKWISWCEKRHTDPVSGPVSEVANFLADLFEKGYQQRSINAYRSAIASAHDRVDGVSVGQHPTVTRLMAGVANLRPPQPRYSSTWDVNKVLDHITKKGANKDLNLKDLTLKTTMLLALTRPSRSADLHSLDIRLFRSSPEGVTFMPSKPAKQTKAGKIGQGYFFPKFEQNPLLCPVDAVSSYMDRTSPLRRREGEVTNQLFVAFIKPHHAVTSSTIARWLKTTLEQAGIDTAIFKAHSTRGASTSAAALRGVTTSDIILAADWSSDSVFRRFYYKPVHDPTFGKAILSRGGN